jgi:hypothetical protein
MKIGCFYFRGGDVRPRFFCVDLAFPDENVSKKKLYCRHGFNSSKDGSGFEIADGRF